MRSLKTICTHLFLACALLSADVYAGQRAIRVVARTPEGKDVPLYRGSYAFVVGNENYRGGWDPLPGAVQDANEVADVLKEHGFDATLRTNLSRNVFIRELEAFCHQYGRDEDNRLLFYFAGHGYTRKMANGEDLGYLVMVDAPDPDKDPVGFTLSSVDMQSIVTQAKVIKARHVLFMFDSCFSGSILDLRERVVPQTISESMRLPVRQFITAGRANEPVPDHSIFKQAFLDLLEGRDPEPIPDGYITGEELGLYLKNKVPEYNPSQHPQYGKINDVRLDKGDFVFALKEDAFTQTPDAPTGITDYDVVIQEREAARTTWLDWQARMEKDFQKADNYARSRALTPAEKANAWDSFLASYGADNPYTREDNEMRARAEKQRRRWTAAARADTPPPPPHPLPVTSPGPDAGRRFSMDGNGIVRDTKTSLEWIAGPDRDMTWDEARTWVQRLNRGGRSWRMPTLQELRGLYQVNRGPRNMTPLLETTGWSVWSKESRDASTRWAFLFNFGKPIWYGRNYAYENRAFAVR